ncbi:ribose 1,5-bisphosphokinase, partial [Klebsiella pneumoniae]
TYYGIVVEIDLWLHAGFDVVANGSRAHLALARERYGEVLVPIGLAVSPPVLRQRPEQRGPENPLEIAPRLGLPARTPPRHCLSLDTGARPRTPGGRYFT